MSWLPSDDELLSNHGEGPAARFVALPQGAILGAYDDTRIDMDHKPGDGEVRGIRVTMDRFTKQLVEGGTPPAEARQIARTQANRMERRLHRGPKDTRSP